MDQSCQLSTYMLIQSSQFSDTSSRASIHLATMFFVFVFLSSSVIICQALFPYMSVHHLTSSIHPVLRIKHGLFMNATVLWTLPTLKCQARSHLLLKHFRMFSYHHRIWGGAWWPSGLEHSTGDRVVLGSNPAAAISLRNFGYSVYPALPMSFGGDTKIRWPFWCLCQAHGKLKIPLGQSALEMCSLSWTPPLYMAITVDRLYNNLGSGSLSE